MRRLAVIGAILMLLTGVLGQAQATVRGKNGRIAFRRYLNKAETRGAIFTIKPDGTGERQITHPRRGFVTDEPDWSPNGRWIVYHHEAEGEFPSRLFKIRPDGSNRKHLSGTCERPCGDSFPAWSPKGKRIALQRESCGTGMNNLIAIYVMRADGTHPRRVTHKNATCASSHRFSDHTPQWSPSGNRLTFERFDNKRGKQAIFTIRLDSSGLRRLTPWRIDASAPDWSPKGTGSCSARRNNRRRKATSPWFTQTAPGSTASRTAGESTSGSHPRSPQTARRSRQDGFPGAAKQATRMST
jgi:TolB protein